MTNPTLTEKDVAEIAEKIAAKLSIGQREALLAIRPGEERRAIDFKGSVARGLQWHRRSRPALLAVVITGRGTVAWYRHTPAGLAVRNHLISTPNMPKGDG
jgi:hypothetical protein